MMYYQQNWYTIVGYFRPGKKYFLFNGSLLFLLILLVGIVTHHQAAARPSQDEDFIVNDEFRNVDNLEIHHVKMVDGVSQEDHPIIIYKEDFVSEDYVPSKNETKSEKQRRRYKDISRRRRHRQNITDVVIEEKPEKILFDIIPETPIILPEDMDKPRKSHIKFVPLVPLETNDDEPKKEELHKRPKKFHRRVKREANSEHIVHKRNPFFRNSPKVSKEIAQQIQYIYIKHSIPGKKHNGLDIPIPGPTRKPISTQTSDPSDNMPISFDNRVAADENDRVIFASGRPRPTSAPTESIFRDPKPENFDFSFMNPQRQTTTRTPIFTRRPETRRPQEESIFRDPSPENFDFSFMTNRGSTGIRRTTPQTATPQGGISQCVWAIINCCSNRNTEIRYNCFEQNGCYGAFWDLNPCADNVRDNFINYVADYYN